MWKKRKGNLPTLKTKKKKFSLGNIFLIIGIVLIAFGVIYEAVNYPWGHNSTPKEPSSMSEPKPLPYEYASFYEEDFVDVVLPETIPSQDSGTPLSRPEIPLIRMGTIKIPRISLSENILEGAGDEILYGVGHVSGTALPNEKGNFVLAGHRAYVRMNPFRHLDKLEKDDIIEVTYEGSGGVEKYTYRIYDWVTVLPTDTWVMDKIPDHEQTITLVTCTPIPSYSERLVYFGELISVEKEMPVNVNQ